MRIQPVVGYSSKGGLLYTGSFGKADRILNRSDFIALSRRGKRIENKHFIVIVGAGETQASRLGITVTKKVGQAVARNRIKRLIREYFRLNRHQIAGCWDINIIAKKLTANLSSDEIYSSLRTIFELTAKEVS